MGDGPLKAASQKGVLEKRPYEKEILSKKINFPLQRVSIILPTRINTLPLQVAQY